MTWLLFPGMSVALFHWSPFCSVLYHQMLARVHQSQQRKTPDSLGQDFGQDIGSWTTSVPQCMGPPLGRFWSGVWNHFHSCLILGYRGPKGWSQSTYTRPLPIDLRSHSMAAGFQEDTPWEEVSAEQASRKIQGKLPDLFRPSLRSSLVTSESLDQSPPRGWETDSTFGWARGKTTFQKSMSDGRPYYCPIFGKYNLPARDTV